MATPRELVRVVAEATGLPLNTIIQHDRNLSVAGLRTVAGRGLAAATVTYQDAANLMIAVTASRNVKDSALIVTSYSKLKCEGGYMWEDGKRGATFGDAIASMLEASPSYVYDKDFSIGVMMSGPNPTAKIEISVGKKESHFRFQKIDEAPVPYHWGGDFEFIAKFTHVSIGMIGHAIKLDG